MRDHDIGGLFLDGTEGDDDGGTIKSIKKYLEYSQGTVFQAYEEDLAMQLRFEASLEWSNSKGNVIRILALIKTSSSGEMENR